MTTGRGETNADLSAPLSETAEHFLYREAELLDRWDLDGWVGILTSDIDYRIPVRNTLMHDQPGEQYSSTAFHMVDEYASLKARLDRLKGRAAWSERPHSRMRRHVSNVRSTRTELALRVSSNLLLFWGRGSDDLLVSCAREDVLRVESGGMKLARRTVYLDHDLFPLPNLSLPL